MGKKTRKEEELLTQIKEYKKGFKSSLVEKLFKEREEKHANGEVFFEGYWVPQDKVSKIQNNLLRRGRIIFFEINLLILVIVSFNFFLWKFFKELLLP